MAYTTINKPSDYYNTKLYTGTAATQSITGVNFQPDLVWIKDRQDTYNNHLFDVIRGAQVEIRTDGTNAETTISGTLTSFDSDGFTLGSAGNTNFNGHNMISYNWLADNTTGSSNTDGSVTSTVSANTTSGFSIVKWTGTGANATIGHGLGVAPKMIMVKNRNTAGNGFGVYHEGAGATKAANITTAAFFTTSTAWNNTAPTSDVFSVGSWSTSNGSGADMIAYCFNDVKGYSKFGTYVAPQSTGATFVYTGFKPAVVLIKASTGDGVIYFWNMTNWKSQTYNENGKHLKPNSADAEGDSVSAVGVHSLSNGFYIDGTDGSNYLHSGGNTYIYMAFAEHPLVSSTGTPVTAR